MTLYGTLDAGLIYSNNVGGNSLYKLGSGSVSGTNFGLRGIEDLGHGTSVLFKIEAGFDSNDGTQAESGTLFNRASYVSVQNNELGTLTRPPVRFGRRLPGAAGGRQPRQRQQLRRPPVR